jgi:hypothetical protein
MMMLAVDGRLGGGPQTPDSQPAILYCFHLPALWRARCGVANGICVPGCVHDIRGYVIHYPPGSPWGVFRPCGGFYFRKHFMIWIRTRCEPNDRKEYRRILGDSPQCRLPSPRPMLCVRLARRVVLNALCLMALSQFLAKMLPCTVKNPRRERSLGSLFGCHTPQLPRPTVLKIPTLDQASIFLSCRVAEHSTTVTPTMFRCITIFHTEYDYELWRQRAGNQAFYSKLACVQAE